MHVCALFRAFRSCCAGAAQRCMFFGCGSSLSTLLTYLCCTSVCLSGWAMGVFYRTTAVLRDLCVVLVCVCHRVGCLTGG
mmetsp:Transcript_53922/g.135524  ORF Transcript_53922/g.135524 Transcript_53922/m.135524 type:complete len:80 (+) Transcript_53922:1369-1608(+)